MSGICGIVNLDGAPVDRLLLETMTSCMDFRGPDTQGIWIGGSTGFGHAMLRTTFESELEKQPCSLEGETWITADARIDGRDELRSKIAATGRIGSGAISANATDVDLILHAYCTWGIDCLDHLIGDFSFALWDGRRKQLFCARDHFGIKPFFYARVGGSLVFSNTLNCVRKHPAVSCALNDLSIADFLLFDGSQDPEATAFADIRRLPPAQYLTCSVDGLKVNSYWSLSTDTEIRYRAAGDYVHHFRSLFEKAVADRLRTAKVGVEMSGGLDSTAIAATVKILISRQPVYSELSACTIAYDHLIPNEERLYAEMTARALRIPIHCHVADNYQLYDHYRYPDMRIPEPVHEPDAAAWIQAMKVQANRGRVLLTGWDGDALLSESPKPYFRWLLKQGRLVKLVTGVIQHAISKRRQLLSRLGNLMAQGRKDVARHMPDYPAWVNPELEERLALRARWHDVTSAKSTSHPMRPYAHKCLGNTSQWSAFFDCYDPGISGIPIEFRHPFLDLRLVDYCLKLPSYPWCVEKSILREAMRGLLPEPVRRRPKTPLGEWPGSYMLRAAQAKWVDDFNPEPGLEAYVNRKMIPKIWGGDGSIDAWANLRPLSLNFWMQQLHSPVLQKKGAVHEFA